MLNQDKGEYWCRSSLHSIYQYNGSSGNNEKETVHIEMKNFLNELFYFQNSVILLKPNSGTIINNYQYRRYHITDFNTAISKDWIIFWQEVDFNIGMVSERSFTIIMQDKGDKIENKSLHESRNRILLQKYFFPFCCGLLTGKNVHHQKSKKDLSTIMGSTRFILYGDIFFSIGPQRIRDLAIVCPWSLYKIITEIKNVLTQTFMIEHRKKSYSVQSYIIKSPP